MSNLRPFWSVFLFKAREGQYFGAPRDFRGILFSYILISEGNNGVRHEKMRGIFSEKLLIIVEILTLQFLRKFSIPEKHDRRRF
jgi:hypothetical protein